MKNAKVIAIALQKGGVGKSTSSQALASTLGAKGYKTLLIDLDSQGNVTYASGIENFENSSYEVLNSECNIENAILNTKYYDILPSDRRLTNATLELNPSDNKILRQKIDQIKNVYDFIIIDTPPALGVLSINALVAADYLIIPTEASTYSLQGINELYDTIDAVKRINERLSILGILLVKYSNRTVLNRQIREMIEDYAKSINTKLFSTSIREGIAVKEAQAMQEPLIDYAPKSKPNLDYKAFVDEMLKELK